MTKTVRLLLVVALVAAGAFGTAGTAAADFENSDAANQQEGDNSASAEQAGGSASGDAVGGQVTGVVSSGDASVDARNRSEDVDVQSGNAAGSNTAESFVGHDFQFTSITQGPAQDFESSTATNQQEGDNTLDLTQSVDASSGDAVGGQVIGVVTSAGGSADIVADNASEDVDAETGDAFADSFTDAFVGHEYFAFVFTQQSGGADFENSAAANQQDGDNALDAEQTADASTGDGVAGQVIGAVSAGDASIDARNRSEDVDVSTGDAFAGSFANPFVGLQVVSVNVEQSSGADFESSTAANQQEGDNSIDLAQTATSSTGDGVGGQVIGAVTSAGGSADIVADNASEDVDVSTGDAFAGNFASPFAGLSFASVSVSITFAADFEFSTATANQQDGDNDASLDQTADASTGDGVAGQVIGAVSAGDASIDARNRSEDVEVETGDAGADNGAGAFVGLSAVTADINVQFGGGGADFESSSAVNQQEGDNALDLTQTATASTGDGVGGQVIGAVTAAGGSADIVADNASEDVDVSTGDAFAGNFSDSFVGLNFLALDVSVTFADFESATAVNQQDGDNALDVSQTADASSGDGVAGQVIGAVSAGDASIDARNRSEDVELETGVAEAVNFSSAFVGLNFSSVDIDVAFVEDFESSTAVNQQEGDNDAGVSQTATASSGDAVGGQVVGVVTSAGGSADAVLDNASEDVDAETGPSFFENADDLFVGLSFGTEPLGNGR